MKVQFLLQIVLIITLLCSISSFVTASIRKELRMKYQMDQKSSQQFNSLIQPARVDPSRVIQLSGHPRVFLYRGFLSDEECNHLISLALDKLETSFVNNSDSREIADSNQLTTSVTHLGEEEDDIVSIIEDRISAWTFLPKVNSEPVKITHHLRENTQEHLNYYNDKPMMESDTPLMATVVLYLSNVTQGGETHFPKSKSINTQQEGNTWSDCAKTGLSVKPIKGNALLFFNLHLNTTPDESSFSARCPVVEGEKWCAIKFFHLSAIEGKAMSLELENDECSDEEETCPRWAANGECERNPVYMKGTPDYSGSCRKSCHAC